MDLAADMLKTFSEMRGVVMKIGQMFSYLDDAIPPEARKISRSFSEMFHRCLGRRARADHLRARRLPRRSFSASSTSRWPQRASAKFIVLSSRTGRGSP